MVIADLNGDGISDLIVANTGGNDVFVYLGLGHGQFAPPQQFFTGTAPVGLTVADLTGNGLPDLIVANSGSNDITILARDENPRRRLDHGPQARGSRLAIAPSPRPSPTSRNGDMDIVVVNQDSDTVTLLRGLGGGFFDDKNPPTLATGLGPVQAFVGHFTSSTSLRTRRPEFAVQRHDVLLQPSRPTRDDRGRRHRPGLRGDGRLQQRRILRPRHRQ